MTAESWDRLTLAEAIGSVRALQSGPFGTQLRASEYVSEGVPVVMPRDIRTGRISTREIARVSSKKAQALERFRVRRGDILLARRGEMGRCARVESESEGWICGTGCMRIRPGQRIDSGFLFHLLRREATAAWLEDRSVGQTLPSLNVRTVAEMPLLLPRLTRQKKIAEILDSLDSARRASQQASKCIQRLRGRIMQRVLLEDPRPGLLSLYGKAFDRASWPRKPVGSLCKLLNGHAFRVRDRAPKGLPIIRIQNLNGSKMFHRFAGHPSPSWTVEPGDLLFSWSGIKGSSFGPRIWNGPKGVLNQHIFKVVPRDGVVKGWLFESLELVSSELEKQAHGFKSSLVHFRKGELANFLVSVPERSVQDWIAEKSALFTKLQRAELEILESLRRTRRGLGSELFENKARVASML